MLFKLASLVLGVCALAPLARASEVVASEEALQAALLYNFAAFTAWPATSSADVNSDKLVFCVMGSAPLAEALNERQKKSIQGKAVEVRTITHSAQASTCQLLFVGKTEHKKIHELAMVTRNAPVVMVAEEGDFDLKDVIISMREKEGRYTFKINQTGAQARSLALSAKMLKLAAQVY